MSLSLSIYICLDVYICIYIYIYTLLYAYIVVNIVLSPNPPPSSGVWFPKRRRISDETNNNHNTNANNDNDNDNINATNNNNSNCLRRVVLERRSRSRLNSDAYRGDHVKWL